MAKHLVRLGAVTDMPTLYHAADALLLPSLWEGLPNAVLEGHASALPALVSHAANVDRIVLHGESGLEVPTLGIGLRAEALGLLIETPAEQLRRMGERGRAHVAASLWAAKGAGGNRCALRCAAGPEGTPLVCGIAGFLAKQGDARPDPRVVQRFAAAMIHRGPDGGGFFFAGPAALAHRRLSIIDLSAGRTAAHDQ